MRKNLLIAIILLIIGIPLYAQTSRFFNYQAVARNNSWEPIQDQIICVRFTILADSISQTTLYTETFKNVATNHIGLFTLRIGSGNPIEFFSIDWSTQQRFLRVEIDPNSDDDKEDFIDMGISPFSSVPIAIHADRAKFAEQAQQILTFQEADSSFLVPGTTSTANLFEKWTWDENNHVYALFTTDNLITWLEAQELARRVRGHLITITSSAENEFMLDNILSLPVSKGKIPLGYTDGVQEGLWQWITGEIGIASPQNPFGYWFTGEPNNDDLGENVSEILEDTLGTERRWNDIDSNRALYEAVIIEFSPQIRP